MTVPYTKLNSFPPAADVTTICIQYISAVSQPGGDNLFNHRGLDKDAEQVLDFVLDWMQ